MNLEELRVEIDKSNKEIVEAIAKRFVITRQIGEIKAKQNLPPLDKARENVVMEKVKLLARNNNLDENMIEKIFRIIMDEVVNEHNKIQKETDKILVKKIDKINNVKIEIPGSKSYTNRALIIASLANGKTVLHNPLYSDDTMYMMQSLEKLGIKFEKQNNDLIVFGNGGNFNIKENIELFCGIAGTTSRFLTGLLALVNKDLIINGEGKILERPIGELVDGLKQIGVNIEYLGKYGSLPLKGNGKSISSNEISINGSISSQYFSALMMIAPLLKNGLIINVLDKQIS